MEILNADIGLGWGVPPLWAIVWTLITFPTVQYCLRKEEKAWELRHAHHVP